MGAEHTKGGDLTPAGLSRPSPVGIQTLDYEALVCPTVGGTMQEHLGCAGRGQTEEAKLLRKEGSHREES